MTDQALDSLARRVMLDATRLEYGELMKEPPEHDFSPEFERKMQKLIQQVDHPVRHRCLRTVQLAALLAALLMLVTIATAAAGYDIWRMLAQWTAEKITLAPGQIEYADPDDIHIPEGPGEYANIQEALTAYGFNRSVVPKWLPEGFTQTYTIDPIVNDGLIIFHTLYHREKHPLIVQVNIYLENENRAYDSFENFQKDEGDPIPYEAGGITHLLVTNAGRNGALWANGPAECTITGDITMEELKEMIDSIYE
ncbi:DUF4367 domain-containing protein [uncultured Oscillibacter sp.]|uniref:DUF4367 domain-containing protein n=1 Tax=uncultured Oscillibacter sp. TaxID=876091 RepID=UPI00260B0BE4|nr:DUF4367 domain-containing protein [uncultured Oscillibacter sp.]